MYIAPFDRQLISMHKHVMCCAGTVVGLQLSDDGANKQQNAEEQELICE